MGNLDYFGNTGLVLADPGTLETDYTGLVQISSVWKCPIDGNPGLAVGRMPKLYAKHPLYPFLELSHRSVALEGAWAVATCRYGGFQGSEFTPPVYEMSVSLSQLSIQLHPKFTTLAGKPTDPKNGSLWVSLVTGRGLPPGEKADSDEGWKFAGWSVDSEFAGETEYLCPIVTWRETINRKRGWVAVSSAGKIDTPRGRYPRLSGGNWLNMGTSMTIHGAAVQATTEWRHSRPGGKWNAKIY